MSQKDWKVGKNNRQSIAKTNISALEWMLWQEIFVEQRHREAASLVPWILSEAAASICGDRTDTTAYARAAARADKALELLREMPAVNSLRYSGFVKEALWNEVIDGWLASIRDDKTEEYGRYILGVTALSDPTPMCENFVMVLRKKLEKPPFEKAQKEHVEKLRALLKLAANMATEKEPYHQETVRVLAHAYTRLTSAEDVLACYA